MRDKECPADGRYVYGVGKNHVESDPCNEDFRRKALAQIRHRYAAKKLTTLKVPLSLHQLMCLGYFGEDPVAIIQNLVAKHLKNQIDNLEDGELTREEAIKNLIAGRVMEPENHWYLDGWAVGGGKQCIAATRKFGSKQGSDYKSIAVEQYEEAA